MTEQSFYYGLIVVWLVLAAVTFVSLFFVTAPYGKFTRKGWGPTMGRVTGWMIMESPAALLMPVFFLIGDKHTNPVAIVFLLIWELHYIQRTYIFPLRMRGNKEHITILTVLLAIVFNTGNAYLNGRYLFTLSPPLSSAWFVDPRFIIGLVLFLAGFVINIKSDNTLRTLRKPGETEYKIPTGGFFEYVSQANYFGELVEWLGFAILTWSPGALVFFAWTAANLVPRAYAAHKWYFSHFPNYPQNRKAVIPFVF